MTENKFIVRLDEIPATGLARKITMPETSLNEIANRLQIPAVVAISAEFQIRKNGPFVRVNGTLHAELTRTCVVSLEHLPETINELFQVDFLPSENRKKAEELELEIGEDDPEPMEEDWLDLSEIAIQQVALEMEPYPRKVGATPVEDPRPATNLSPFAGLKQAMSDNQD